jgi:hypothetical protein
MFSAKKLNNEQSITIKINEKVSYDFSLHESVGFTAEYYIKDEGIIKYINTKVKYYHPERMKPGMTGGDSARGTFIFKAIKQGETELVIKHLFRGEVDKIVKIQITVK